MDFEVKKRTGGLFALLVCVVCAMTNLSQLPFFDINGITRYLSTPFWILLLVVCLINDQMLDVSKVRGILILFVALFIYLVIGVVFGNPFMGSSIDKQIMISIFILITGTFVGKRIHMKDLEKICTFYIWSAAIVCAAVYFQYVRGADLNSRIYVYDSKNSVSQIILFAVILIVFLKFNKDTPIYKRIMYGLACLLFIYTMIGLKSRASLLGIPIIAVMVVSNQNIDKQLKGSIIAVIIGIVVFLAFNPEIYDSFISNIILGGRSKGNLDDISSGRMNEWTNFISDFNANGFFGDTFDKRESIFLSSFLQHGVVGGTLISLMVFYPYLWSRRARVQFGCFSNAVRCVAIVSIVNGVFEQQAPFGPGAKCFLLWFLIGVLSTMNNYDNYLECVEYE